jgi:hypothetical protein
METYYAIFKRCKSTDIEKLEEKTLEFTFEVCFYNTAPLAKDFEHDRMNSLFHLSSISGYFSKWIFDYIAFVFLLLLFGPLQPQYIDAYVGLTTVLGPLQSNLFLFMLSLHLWSLDSIDNGTSRSISCCIVSIFPKPPKVGGMRYLDCDLGSQNSV